MIIKFEGRLARASRTNHRVVTSMEDIQFTTDERLVLEASEDSARTIRRRRLAVITGVVLVAVILAAAYLDLPRELILIAFAVYVVGAMIERIAYANAVLAYKSVIRKLLADRAQSGRSQ